VATKLKTGIAESLREPLMKIAQQLLISDKRTFDQLTPTEQKLWTNFETADIYRFLTGEEDTVPEFQYNWICPKASTFGSLNNHSTHSGQYRSTGSSSSTSTASSLSTKLLFKQITSHEHTALIADSFYIRNETEDIPTPTNAAPTA
jgi:hypothetical protein